MEVLPTHTTNLVVQATAAATTVSRDERHHDLQLHQMIRATVEEGGQEKALLQFGDRRLWVDTGTPLKAGDTLNLQVVETQPTISFKIIEPTILQRLGQSLHLLGNRLDTLALLPAMLEGQEPGAKKLSPEVRDALGRLLALLKKTPPQLAGRELGSLPRQLGLYQEADLLAGRTAEAQGTLKNAFGQLEAGHRQQLTELAAHLEPLFDQLGRIPALLQDPAAAEALLNNRQSTLAAVLRPLLRLAQAVPEASSPQLSAPVPTPAAAAAAAAAPNAQEAVGSLVRALSAYLHPAGGLPGFDPVELEQQLSPLPHLLRQRGVPAPGNDLLGSLARLLRHSAEPPAAAEPDPSARQLAAALRHSFAPSPQTAGQAPPAAMEPALTRLAQVLAEIPAVLRQSGQVGPFLERQPQDLTAVLRPLLRLAASIETAENPVPSPPLRQTAPTTALSRTEAGRLALDFVAALRNYLQPFAELTGESLERIEQQAALLPQIVQGPFEQALAAIGQKPQGKDLLGALFHLLRNPPERLTEGLGAKLSQQLVETLQKIIEQENIRIEEKHDDALRQLELWQLCRTRLGDTDASLVPLPLPFLNNGFLVARRQKQNEDETDPKDQIASVSLFLDLQKLGPLQVDLLHQNDELFVRFKCQDQAAADFISAARSELGEALGDIRLTTVAVSTGAESPDRALVRLLIPPEKGLVDARV